MKTLRLLLLVSTCFLLSSSFVHAQQGAHIGSGTTLYFAGSSPNAEHVDLDTIAKAIATSDFTVEFWELLDANLPIDSDIPFICNKNWANGVNQGFVISRQSGAYNQIWVNFTTGTGTRFDKKNVNIPTLTSQWTHIAVTFDRHGSTPKVIIYANGIAIDSANFSALNNPTASISGNGKHTRLCQDETGNYLFNGNHYKYKGYLDEVRIWNTVRTADEIRSNMCHKLTGTESGLVANYDFNDGAGTSLTNKTGAEDGALVNMTGTSEWVYSGAPIGDVSVYTYPSSWTAAQLQLTSAQNGNMTINNFTGSIKGAHLYRVDSMPNTTNGIYDATYSDLYYGVFVVENPATTGGNLAPLPLKYNIAYDYANFSSAMANKPTIKLYNRYRNDYTTWADLSSTNQQANNKFVDTIFYANRKEIILADFVPQSCQNPVNPYIDSLTTNFARIKWTSTGNNWQVQYGQKGFSIGTGTMHSVTGTPKDTMQNLAANTYYDVYVRNICSATDTSMWTGPVTFRTQDPCPTPTILSVTYLGGDSVKITWTNMGATSYFLQWGPVGFALSTGIPVNNLGTNSYVLTGLSNTQQYDVYIQDSCNGIGRSYWLGPVTFTASGPVPTSINNTNNPTNNITVYPNPAKDNITIQNSNNEKMTVTLYNFQGQIVKTVNVDSYPYTMDVKGMPTGMYMLQCRGNNTASAFKVNIQN